MRSWQTRPEPPRTSDAPWKRYLGEACPHGLSIALVDGTYVRDHMDSDFCQGGNEFRYDFVPVGELWVEDQIDPDEWALIAFHECHESELMRRGQNYGPAHDEAKRLEDEFRKLRRTS